MFYFILYPLFPPPPISTFLKIKQKAASLAKLCVSGLSVSTGLLLDSRLGELVYYNTLARLHRPPLENHILLLE